MDRGRMGVPSGLLKQMVPVEPWMKELQIHQKNYHANRARRDTRMDQWWRDRASLITDEWEYTNKPCDCWGAEDQPHTRIRFRYDDKWYSICPIVYWFLLKRYDQKYNNVETLEELLHGSGR